MAADMPVLFSSKKMGIVCQEFHILKFRFVSSGQAQKKSTQKLVVISFSPLQRPKHLQKNLATPAIKSKSGQKDFKISHSLLKLKSSLSQNYFETSHQIPPHNVL